MIMIIEMIKWDKIKLIKFKVIKYLLQLVNKKYTLQHIKHNKIALSLAQLSPHLLQFIDTIKMRPSMSK